MDMKFTETLSMIDQIAMLKPPFVAVLSSFVLAIFTVIPLSAQERDFDETIRRLMKRENVNGLAVAVRENGQVARVQSFG